MNIRFLFLTIYLALIVLVHADEPIYSVKLKPAPNFTLPSGAGMLSFHPLSTGASQVFNGHIKRKIKGAGYVTGIEIQTKEPRIALQEILLQICEQTGLQLGKIADSSLAKLSPITLLQGFSETAVVNLLLTPSEGDASILSCSYVVYERPENSIDGTPAAIAQMEAMRQQMNADSVAQTLPSEFTKNAIKLSDYCRGGLSAEITDRQGKNPLEVLTLHLKTGNHYILGVYQEKAGAWHMIEEPLDLSGFGPAGIYEINGISSLRCRKSGGGSGFDIFIEDGHLIKSNYAE